MKYLVMGYDYGKIILLTSKVFDNLKDAMKYKSSCGAVWQAFVVQEVLA